MGVDAISHLKCNSIRELHRFHQETGKTLEWTQIANQNNGLLLYVIASQFLNERACYEELVACCEELLLFQASTPIVIPIFLDDQLGGVHRVNQCFSFLFSSLLHEQPPSDCAPAVFSWYERIACYLPFSLPLLHAFQAFFAVFPSLPLLRCMIRLSQNHVPAFVQSITAADNVSSSLVSLLNALMCSVSPEMEVREMESFSDDGFVSIVWQFVAKCLEVKEDVLYASDLMVLIDIVTRAVKNESDSLPVVVDEWSEA